MYSVPRKKEVHFYVTTLNRIIWEAKKLFWIENYISSLLDKVRAPFFAYPAYILDSHSYTCHIWRGSVLSVTSIGFFLPSAFPIWVLPRILERNWLDSVKYCFSRFFSGVSILYPLLTDIRKIGKGNIQDISECTKGTRWQDWYCVFRAAKYFNTYNFLIFPIIYELD